MRYQKGNISMIYELVKKNRSYRGYDESVKVSRETLEELVECARLTASSVNRQPLKYFLACEEETAALVQQETRWAKGLPDLTLPHPGKCPTAFIVICQDDRIDQNLNRFQKDIGIVAQTMLLAAAEKDLGGCMIGNFRAGSLSAALGLNEHIHPLLILAIGRPDEQVRIVEVGEDGSVDYYRDEQDIHYVPKRSLADELLN